MVLICAGEISGKYYPMNTQSHVVVHRESLYVAIVVVKKINTLKVVESNARALKDSFNCFI